MQMFRKAAVTAVVLGAGLASTAGVAMAHEHADAGKSCSNAIGAKGSNGADRTLGDTTGGAQNLSASNTCDIFNGNTLGSDNNTAGTDITNGNTKTVNEARSTTSSSNVLTQLTGVV